MKLATLIALVVTLSAFGHDHPAPVMPKEFDTLKKLEGNWKGKTSMNGKEMDATVSYRTTSGGSAMTETLGAGTPHEMISVYHKDGKSLAMTHYCALGNQPHMKLKSHDANSMTFEMKGTQGITSIKEPHMHGVKLTFTGPTTMTQTWTHWENGKEKEKATFEFTKVN